MIRKIIGIAICFTAIIAQAGAQGLGIELNGGLQGTHYPLQNGQSQQQVGASLGLLYGFRLGGRWDLLTGVSGGLYRTKASLKDGVVFTSYEVDDAGSAFQFSVKAAGYSETQQFFAASFPLLLQYHTTGENAQWYFDGGGKVFVPFNSSIQVSAKQLVLSGYYPDFNLAISNLPQHGFGTINGWNANATTQLKPAAALSAATGLSFPLAPGTRLYAGVYVDYGLTGLKEKNDSMPLVAYSPTGLTGVKAGSVLNSPNAGKVDLLSFGIQLRLSFGSARSKSAGRSNTTQEPQQTKQDSINDDEYEVLERSVLFGQVGDTVIPDIQKKHLDDLADVLLRHSRIRIALAGHICSSDVEKEDDKVGAARVESVAQYLQSKGIDRGRLDISPVIENHAFEPLDLLANFQNRRVAITVK